MLSEVELPFTYEVNDNLLVVLPQYTKKKHIYFKKYEGSKFNSSLHLNDNVDVLVRLIKGGLNNENIASRPFK